MAFNMDPKKCPMPAQDPQVRRHNFDEVALGYTAEMAVNEPALRRGLPRGHQDPRVHRPGGRGRL